jgi:hypothetical protein
MTYEGQSDAFDEVVRVIGRELQASRGRIKELEEALTKVVSRFEHCQCAKSLILRLVPRQVLLQQYQP